MDKKELVVAIGALLVTLHEVGADGLPVPASPVYMALGWDMNKYLQVTGGADLLGYTKTGSSTIRLTEKGKKMAEEVQKVWPSS